MGNGATKVAPENNGSTMARKQRDKKIEERVQAKKRNEAKMVKVLLLGAGECGKSTVLKQFKILHLDGFSDDDKAQYVELCRRNTLEATQQLSEATRDKLGQYGVQFDSDDNKALAEKLLALSISETVDIAIAADIKTLWADSGIQKALTHERHFYLLDSAKYFLKSVDRVFDENFEPTDQDMLRARLMTTGILETLFTLESTPFKVYDVGGQRGERKKWIHCFDDVTAILFIASLSEYDQVLAEDRTRNRLVESLDLFEGIANLPWFENASIMLFLNKKDLFEEKVKRVNIGDFHPDYEGQPCDYDDTLEFIKDEYIDRNEHEDKNIYVHVTDATNTENVKFVWDAVQHTILENKLQHSGLQMC